ncbi:MAG: 4-oxalocrotonate tautomerase [Proteobacteria bacterium]|nr:4-oxalocrotonate tautomerase [Pseudomonadota bacterium]
MPFVNVKTAKGLLTHEQKAELCARLTDVIVAVEGRGNPAFRDLIWVLIEEHEPWSWCIGGTQISPHAISELALGQHVAAPGVTTAIRSGAD